ncbi:MAG: hypothetical protein NZ455_03650 [Bacteroidia bacterium]|nr:hypothetical protein [Bacteroidia bacterium]MDW8347557.1 hypothetical protein [Bacteroidia bacterium]
MELLEAIIRNLSKGEVKIFRTLSRKLQNNGESTQYLELFNYIYENKLTSEQIMEKIGLSDNPNAYYRLRNRLMDVVSKTVVFMYHENNTETNTYVSLAFSKILTRKNMAEEALYFSEKALKNAQTIEDNELVVHALTQMINVKQNFLYEDTSELRKQRELTLEKEREIREIDDYISRATLELKKINFSSNYYEFKHSIERLFNKLNVKGTVSQSGKARIFITTNILHLLLQQGRYIHAKDYFVEQYKIMEKESIFNETNHDKKIALLDMYVNILVYNNDLNEALTQNEHLWNELEKYDKVFLDAYEFLYYKNLYVIHTAKGTLKEYLPRFADFYEKASEKKNKFYNTHFELITLINLIIGYFSFEEYEKAADLCYNLFQHKDFSKMAEEYIIGTKILYAVILFHQKKFEQCLEKLEIIQKEHKEFLIQKSAKSDTYFIQILQYLCQSGRTIQDKALATLVRKCIYKANQRWPGSVVLYYKVWIHAEYSQKNYYEMFMNLINTNQL